LILEYLETIPHPGTGLKLGDLSVEILQTAENSVKTARVRPIGLQFDVPASKGVA
jgi:Mg2+/Co2+ transporter CorB